MYVPLFAPLIALVYVITMAIRKNRKDGFSATAKALGWGVSKVIGLTAIFALFGGWVGLIVIFLAVSFKVLDHP